MRYATFKTEFLNGLVSGSIKKPKDLNTILSWPTNGTKSDNQRIREYLFHHVGLRGKA
jgi:hypothetical protein